MSKFDLDFSLVHKLLYKDPNKIPVKGNEHRMIKVAFDLFKLKDDNKEDLWQIQADDDGEFLVRTYSLPEENVTTSNWDVKEDSKNLNATILYKGIPIYRIALDKNNDSYIFCNNIKNKLSIDKKFISTFVDSLPEIKKNLLKEAGFEKDLENLEDNLEEDHNQENECGEPVPYNLTVLELEIKLRKNAAMPPPLPIPIDLQFDFPNGGRGNKSSELEKLSYFDDEEINKLIDQMEKK